jgi:electron transfer flavoprotein beta subunit
MVNIIVCIKQVLDPEAPVSAYEVDEEAKVMTQKGVPPMMSPFDENALEAALRIKEATGEAKITVVSMGKALSKAVLRKALAAGADDLVLVEEDALDNLDSYATAAVLAAAIQKIGEYDVILTGMQAADWNAGIVGSGIAEILGIASVTTVREVTIADGKATVKRVLADGYEVIETSLPAVFTVSNELGELRATALKEIMAAQKKPITTWTAEDVGVTVTEGKVDLKSLAIPQKESRCEMVPGADEEELGANLANKLRESQII